jgi:hypothetical protein
MAVSKVLMECPYGHDAKPIKLESKRNNNQHYDYVRCNECQRVFIHDATRVSFFSEGNEVEFSHTLFYGSWVEENGTWRGANIVFKVVDAE